MAAAATALHEAGEWKADRRFAFAGSCRGAVCTSQGGQTGGWRMAGGHSPRRDTAALAACSESLIFLRNINDSEHAAKAHDVQIRSQAETPTAQAATWTAKARGAQIRSRAETPAAQAD